MASTHGCHGRTPMLQALHDYWNDRAPFYNTQDTYGRVVMRSFIDKLHPNSSIEIGCGNGELFQIYRDIPKPAAIDWSDVMVKRANMRKDRHGLINLKIWRHDITQCSPTGHYDVAITRTVLMHIPPDCIEKTIRHMVKVADAFLIFEYFESAYAPKLAAHCWNHNYKELFETQGCNLIEAYQRPDQPQILFYFKKRLNCGIG